MLTSGDALLLETAIFQARESRASGGIPIGAAIADSGGRLLGRGHNQRVQLGSAIRHGEMDALENAGRLTAATYRGATIATTLSPCPMCTGAILLYGIGRVVIGESATFSGPEELLRAAGVDVIPADSALCRELMADFIAAEPELWNEDIGR